MSKRFPFQYSLPLRQLITTVSGRLSARSHTRGPRGAGPDLEKRRERQRRWKRNNPDRVAEFKRLDKVKRKYGLTADEYAQMFADHGHVCAVCRRPESIVDDKGNSKLLSV